MVKKFFVKRSLRKLANPKNIEKVAAKLSKDVNRMGKDLAKRVNTIRIPKKILVTY